MTPEIERGLISSSFGLGAGYLSTTGFLIHGNYTRALSERMSAGVTLGYNSYLNADASTKSYMLYGSNVRFLLLNDVLNKSLEVAAGLNYLNEKIVQLVQPGILAKYVFKGSPHFLNASLFFDKYFSDEGYVNQFLGKSNTSVHLPIQGYTSSLSYHYQLSEHWSLALKSNYSDHKTTKKEMFDKNHSIARQKKLELMPMIALDSMYFGYGYDLLNKKWGFSAVIMPVQVIF